MGNYIKEKLNLTKMRNIYRCNLCNSKKIRFEFEGYDKIFKIKKKYAVWSCSECNLLFLNPQPSFKELQNHYPEEEYYSFKNYKLSKLQEFVYKNDVEGKKNNIIKKTISKIINPFYRSTRAVKNGNFLDVGCGSGDFLYLMEKTGMNCYGLEPSINQKSKKRNIKIIKKTLEDANFKSNFFDTITLHHVFEHVEDPEKTISELFRISKPGSKVIITTPQSNSWAYKIFKKHWTQLDIPRHTFIYNTKNLCNYGKKSGFKIEKIRYVSKPFALIYSYYYWTKRNKQKDLWEKKGFVSIVWFRRFIFVLLVPLTILSNLLKQGEEIEITYLKTK